MSLEANVFFSEQVVPDEEEAQRQKLSELQTHLRVMIWGDHSSLSGHGYLLYAVIPLYDTAVFASTSHSSDQLRQIERPHLYLLAQATDTCEDKLMYIAERRLDLIQFALPLKIDGLPDFLVTLRGFKGDNPEQELKLGSTSQGISNAVPAAATHTAFLISSTAMFNLACLTTTAKRSQLLEF